MFFVLVVLFVSRETEGKTAEIDMDGKQRMGCMCLSGSVVFHFSNLIYSVITHNMITYMDAST